MHDFDPHAPEIKHVQDDKNTCVLSSMPYDFFVMNKHVAEHAVVSQLLSSLSCDTVGFMNRINFSRDILTYSVRNKGEQRYRYKIFQWNIK